MSTLSVCLEQAEIAPEEVRDQLERILKNHRFVSAERNAGFLRFVVEHVLAGKADEVKETVIASELYGRPSDYDPKVDSIVRVEATRLRSRLQAYYEGEGRRDPIRITLPKGTYVPRFDRVEVVSDRQPDEIPAVKPIAVETSVTIPAAPRRSKLQGWHWIVLAGTILFFGWLWRPDLNERRVNPEAELAWKEGNELLRQDPHNSVTQRGAPPILLRAIERYEFAVAKDPLFAPGWASLAEAYDYAFPYVDRIPAEDAKKAEAAARRAIALDEKFAYGHAMLAVVLSRIRWDFDNAEKSYRRAIALDPRNYNAVVEYADLLREEGRIEEAAAEVRRAKALLPAIPALASKESEILLDQNRPDAAIAAATTAMEWNQHHYRSFVSLGSAWEVKGDFEQALANYRHALQLNRRDRRALPAYGYLLGKLGRRDEAVSVLKQLEDMNSNIRNCAFQIAIVHVGLGEHQKALDWLQRAYETRQAHFPFAGVESRFRHLHRYPKFHQLLGRIGRKAVKY